MVRAVNVGFIFHFLRTPKKYLKATTRTMKKKKKKHYNAFKKINKQQQ